MPESIDSLLNHSCDRRFVLKASLLAFSSLVLGPTLSYAGRLPEGRLTMLNIHTNEKLTLTYRNPSGSYDLQTLKELDWLLRCHFTGQAISIDTNTIEFLNLVDKSLGGNREIHVISGYRSPEYNKLLIREGRHVARNSLHLQGKAVDIRIPGVRLSRIRDIAMDLKLGGVGYYGASDFVHLDSGRFRTW